MNCLLVGEQVLKSGVEKYNVNICNLVDKPATLARNFRQLLVALSFGLVDKSVPGK